MQRVALCRNGRDVSRLARLVQTVIARADTLDNEDVWRCMVSLSKLKEYDAHDELWYKGAKNVTAGMLTDFFSTFSKIPSLLIVQTQWKFMEKAASYWAAKMNTVEVALCLSGSPRYVL